MFLRCSKRLNVWQRAPLLERGRKLSSSRRARRSTPCSLLGSDFRLAEQPHLYECHDRLLTHKPAIFEYLTQRWRDLFQAKDEVLLYDLTSTYFESNPPKLANGLRCFGYSRDKRGDCVLVVIALIVTPEGFPLAYEVLAGNTTDKTTLKDFLARIEDQSGKADQVWVMDRGIPPRKCSIKCARAHRR